MILGSQSEVKRGKEGKKINKGCIKIWVIATAIGLSPAGDCLRKVIEHASELSH